MLYGGKVLSKARGFPICESAVLILEAGTFQRNRGHMLGARNFNGRDSRSVSFDGNAIEPREWAFLKAVPVPSF